MAFASLLILGAACALSAALGFTPLDGKTHLSESVLREVVERMGRDLDSYLEEVASPRMFPQDYPDGLSIRDQEYLQHSSLWANPFPNSGEEENMRLKPDDVKQRTRQDNNLPAYCNPPNPCPIGFTAKEDCLEEFENTAAFSREFQARQECMCDTEHMFECSANPQNDQIPDIDRFVQQFQIGDEHKSLVAKKFHAEKKSNPYLQGEILPIAAKKGQFKF